MQIWDMILSNKLELGLLSLCDIARGKRYMKVILLTPWFLEYSIELSNSLSKLHDTNIILIMPKDIIKKILGNNWSNLVRPKIHLKLFNFGEIISLKNILIYPFTLYALIKYIHKLEPDVIHIQESGNIFIVLALPFLRKYPIVSTNHDVRPHMGFKKGIKYNFRELMRNLATKYSDKIIVHGEYLKNLALVYLQLEPEDIFVIPHGEFSIFKKWNKKDMMEEKNTILFFGRIDKYKGLDYLIEAEPIIARSIPKFKIIIAGRCENFQNYEKLISNKERFEFHIRYLSNEEIPELFMRASIVVLPYVDASQSGIIPIAYAFKKPVVVTDVGSLPEVVDNGKTGFIVPSRDSQALAKAVVELLINDKLRGEMSKNAYKKILTDLSWDTIAKSTIEAYKIAIKSKSYK
jgi:alpha-maltose-1-phosphate synthase